MALAQSSFRAFFPRGEGKPSTTRRSGPPAACASMVQIITVGQVGRVGRVGLPYLACLASGVQAFSTSNT